MKRDGLSVSFRPKKDTPTTRGFTPLQAADILAYEMLRIVRHRTAKRRSFLALDQIPGDLGGFDEKTLEKLKDRMDFFVEHPDLRARTEWL